MTYKIAVLVKQVPDMNAFRIDKGTGSPVFSGQMTVSSYDECAIEAALQVVEAEGGEVVVFAAGPAAVKDAVTRALAMGADRGVIIPVDDPGATDTLAIADAIAVAVREFGPDLIFAGQASDDFGSGHVGPQVAELLGIPQVGSIASMSLAGQTVVVERDVEDGRQTLELPMPALLLAQVGLNEPRYPSLKGIMAAKKKPIESSATPVGGSEGRISWGAPYVQQRESAGVILQDVPAADAAAQLVDWLKERKLV